MSNICNRNPPTNEIVKETNFFEDLSNKEGKQIHRCLLKQMIMRKFPSSLSDEIVFDDKHEKDIDDVVSFRGITHRFEYKTDYRAFETGNLVFEIIPYVTENSFPKEIVGIRFSKKYPKDFEALMGLVDKIKSGNIVEAKISRHLSLSESPYRFSYAVLGNNDGVHKHMIFNGKTLSDFVANNYAKGDLIVTKTKNFQRGTTWYTVSWIVPLLNVMNIAIYIR